LDSLEIRILSSREAELWLRHERMKEETRADIFTPLDMGTMKIRGRYLRSGTSESGSEPDGSVRDALGRMYVNLAKGGTPLIITGFAYVRQDGRSGLDQNAIHEERLIARWHEITDAVHAADSDCRICMQIVHGGRQCKPQSVSEPMAPSAVPDQVWGITPRQMTEPEIVDMIEAFGQAARRVKEAGFDAVQLHAAHGYLISEFNSPYTNRRTDAWGGTPEKRMRFFREILDRCRWFVGDDFPILTKINCTDCMPNGLEPEECAGICRTLIDDGIDAIELSAWMAEAEPARMPSRKVDPAPKEEGYYSEPARKVRERVPPGVPLGVCGGWRSIEAMNRVIREEGFDFLSASRPFIAEPDIFLRLKTGQKRAACNSCNECIEGDREPVVHCPPIEEGRLSSPYLDRRVAPGTP
jgi:2,4-dienoyl-CoA reductase-like NADH-dependent reductase (Old Yellow Enzyme family)